MQALRKAFIDVNDHRILLASIEIVGLEQYSFERHAVGILETDQLRGAPVIRRALCVAVADAFHLAESAVCGPDVRELIEARCGHDQDVRVFCFGGTAKIFRRHDQLLWGRITVDFVAIETGIVRVFIVCTQQHRLVGIDRTLLRIETNVAQGCFLFPANAFGEVARVFAIGRELPDIVTVINQDVRVIFRPAGDAVRAGRRRQIVLFVVKVRRNVFGEVHSRTGRD